MTLIKTISSVLLAMLVLVSSTNFTVGMHLCMGEVQSVAVFGKAQGCEKERDLPPCHRNQTAPCCEDESVMHTADDVKPSSGKLLSADVAQAGTHAPAILISEIIPTTSSLFVRYVTYDPPLRSNDLTVDNRVLLI